MDTDAPRGLLRYFQEMDDPRGPNIRHALGDVLAIAILAVVCGAKSFEDMELFGQCKQSWLQTFLDLPHGIPSHDTFNRVFAVLDPDQFERCFMTWTAALAQKSDGRLLAVDGKAIRRSFDAAHEKSAIHMVSVWCSKNQMVLGQVAVDAKSNEITAMPKLLEMLDLKGAVVTADAMHCQKQTVEKIVERQGDYVIQVKGNQGSLHEQLIADLDEAILLGFEGIKHSYAKHSDKGHGRQEVRELWCMSDISWVPGHEQWAGLGGVAVVECTRKVRDRVSRERRYYISSLPGDDAAAMLRAVRGHWGIENRLHWCLDMNFREDESRIRKGHGAQNASRLRRLAMNMLRRDRTLKASLRGKTKACSWDHDYLLRILTQA